MFIRCSLAFHRNRKDGYAPIFIFTAFIRYQEEVMPERERATYRNM